MKQVCAFKFHDGIGFAFFVNEQGKGDARFFAKSTSINAIPKPHSGQVSSTVPEGLFVRAQLRDVFTTEDSTVVAQKDHYGRLADPQRTEAEILTVRIRQGNHRKAAIEGGLHVSILGCLGAVSSPP